MSLPNHTHRRSLCTSVSGLAPTRPGWLVPRTTPDSPMKPMCPRGHPLLQRLALDQQLPGPFMSRSLILAAFLAFIAPFAAAQRHGATSVRSMAPRFATRAAPIVSRVPTVGAVHMSSPARVGTRVVTTRTRAGGTTVRVTRPANIARHRPADNNNNNNEDAGFSEDFSAAPGLGFDETHVVATRGHRSGEHGRNRFDSGFFPFFDGGFILPTPVAVEQAPANDLAGKPRNMFSSGATARYFSRWLIPGITVCCATSRKMDCAGAFREMFSTSAPRNNSTTSAA